MYVKKVLDVAHHRNGVSGAPFSVVRFVGVNDMDGGEEHDDEFVGIVFDGADKFVAVMSVTMLCKGDIAFGSNSWRGDNFEPELREAIKAHDRALYGDSGGDA